MFKDKMYRELREGLELYERARQDETRDPREKIQKEAILCEFLRNEKERDIRLTIKRYRVALKEIEKKVVRVNISVNLRDIKGQCSIIWSRI